MSVFLDLPASTWLASNAHAFAIRDRFPVSPGHTLVITRRLVPDWFAATDAERLAILSLVEEVKRALDDELRPDGYNVGFNAGVAAGQTVMHLHVHVIPRFAGDMDDPSGGVRHVIPSKGNYRRAVKPLASGGTTDPFSRHVFPLFNTAREIAIVAAFVQETGLDHIARHVRDAVTRGARVRILTGDYLDITQASALELLLDWQRTSAAGDDDDDGNDDATVPTAAGPGAGSGSLEARIIEVASLPGLTRAFHPKAWRFEAPTYGVAFVGSSNLSRSALETGIEWNLRVDRDRDAEAYARVHEAFEALWQGARTLDAEWIARYAERVRLTPRALPPGETEPEALEPAPPPHEVQLEALAKLREARDKGWRRALVVLATGLGKTWLAAFDHQQLREEIGAPPRLLFVAHRKELLLQAAQTYRRALHANGQRARIGWCLGDTCDLSAELVFASVAKLARPENIKKLAAERFDYVVVDEVHHAAARSYRTILDALDPRFLLGLTATPDRADTADILGLFDDHLAYRADVERGIAIDRLVPFHYFGVKDDIDYANIPWRNRRFDPARLAEAAQTEARMETMWRAWGEHPGGRTLVFCCSIAHADFVRAWLGAHDVNARAVYSGEGSDDRDDALRDLAIGAIDAVCSVDVFNEGVDVPSVDRVVMLRPTESGVVFLQQLGRGLRAAVGKSAVTVIDFVGNHRVFLERLRTLLSLGGEDAPTLRALLAGASASVGAEPVELPAGCSVELALEAKELLATMFRGSGASEVASFYRELTLERGERPSAGELERLGYPPSALFKHGHAGWFDFVDAEGHLDAKEKRALGSAGAFLRELETTAMTKCFKMITLEALLEAGALRGGDGMGLRELARRSHAILRRSPELFAEVADEARSDELADPNAEKRWLAYWRRNPIEAWTGGGKSGGRAWFKLESGGGEERFVPTFAIGDGDGDDDGDAADPAAAGSRAVATFAVEDAAEDALTALTRELVDYRLAQYRRRQRRDDASAESFVCRVLWNQRDPILKLPSRARVKTLPEGETDVRVDGTAWQFRLAKEFCNVARRAGSPRNELPDLMRRWFGPRAGKPGTVFEVRFERSPEGLWAVPVERGVVEMTPRRGVVAYPDLRAAAGHASGGVESVGAEGADAARVMLPSDSDDPSLFAVRVAGTSMDGGKAPMRDGDWAIMRLARSAPASALEGRVVLVQVPAAAFGSQYQIKRLRKGEAASAWRLTSDNPEGPAFEANEDMIVIARLERVVRPEELAPAVGSVLAEGEVAAAFGLGGDAESGASTESALSVLTTARHGGHLFIVIDKKGLLTSPNRVRFAPTPQRPSETAFVLARRADGAFRYLGVGRWLDTEARWQIPDVDFATWRAWGEGRETSRTLPEGARAQAERVAAAVLALPQETRWLEQPGGQRARVLGPSARGGLRVDGGDGGFGERSVSLTDLAWVAAADDATRTTGAVLDEALVNRVRYLDGTPKGSTRWIDTGWALAAWRLARGDARDASKG